MPALFIIVHILSYVFAGLSLLSFAAGKEDMRTRRPAELLSLSFILGCGVVAVLQFWLALLGLRPSHTSLLLIFAAAALALYFSGGWKKAMPAAADKSETDAVPPGFPVWRLAAFSAIAVSLVLVAANALMAPLFGIDSFALWGFKAKVLYLNGLDMEGYFLNQNYGFSHLDYPLLMPFVSAGIYAANGAAGQAIGKLAYVPLCVSLAVFIYSSTARIAGRSAAILLAALYVSIPAFLHWAADGTADIFVVAFYAVALFGVVHYIGTSSRLSLGSAIFAAAFCVFTKNEGLPIAFIVLASLVAGTIRRGAFPMQWKTILVLLLSALPIVLPWLIWAHGLPKIHENYPAQIHRLFNAENLARFPDVAAAFLREAVHFQRWGVFWLTPILAAPFAGSAALRDRRLMAASLAFVLHLALYFTIFIISPWSVSFLASTAMERLLLHLSVPYLMIAALTISISCRERR